MKLGAVHSTSTGGIRDARAKKKTKTELQHIIPGRKRHRSPPVEEQRETELGLGFYGAGDDRKSGKRPRIRFS